LELDEEILWVNGESWKREVSDQISAIRMRTEEEV
jgi:hypothetical protein